MITRSELEFARNRAGEMIHQAGLCLRADERERIEVADFGLGRLEIEGAQVLTLVQSERIGVKILVLFPGQTLPEHWHPSVGDDPGKEETVRVAWGRLAVYTTGSSTAIPVQTPAGKDALYTVRRRWTLDPGDQLLFKPGEKHWFQAEAQGAVAFSFSTVARDILDRFTDPGIVRQTVVVS
ncbi:MAG: D-lyxose/D-mannose family sugar isomerase [Spirochaetia bacterium]